MNEAVSSYSRYDIRISAGSVLKPAAGERRYVASGDSYSENWLTTGALTRREALAYLRRLTHEAFIGGTNRNVTLYGPRGGTVTLDACSGVARQECRQCSWSDSEILSLSR
jgi:hypothetical protein